MDLSNLKVSFGLPSKRPVGYGVVSKVEEFPGHAIVTMEGVIVPEVKEGEKAPKIVRRFRMSKTAIATMGLLGMAYQKTEEFESELLYIGTVEGENKELSYCIINTTTADEQVRALSFRFAKQGTFSNKPLHDALVAKHECNAAVDNHFQLEIVPSETGLTVALLTPWTIDMMPEEAPQSEDAQEELENAQADNMADAKA
jgi:hypothetical protein